MCHLCLTGEGTAQALGTWVQRCLGKEQAESAAAKTLQLSGGTSDILS